MDGYKFEKKCASMLRRQGFTHVELTGGSGDQGVDILARRHRKKYGIQCKYYAAPVGNKAVQQAYAGARFYDCDVAAVMTNSTYTDAARALAERTEVRLWQTRAKGFGCLPHLWWLSLVGAAGLAALLYLFIPWCLPGALGPGALLLQRVETAVSAAGAVLCVWNRRSWILPAAADVLFLGAVGCELRLREELEITGRTGVIVLLVLTGAALLGSLYLQRTHSCDEEFS